MTLSCEDWEATYFVCFVWCWLFYHHQCICKWNPSTTSVDDLDFTNRMVMRCCFAAGQRREWFTSDLLRVQIQQKLQCLLLHLFGLLHSRPFILKLQVKCKNSRFEHIRFRNAMLISLDHCSEGWPCDADLNTLCNCQHDRSSLQWSKLG